MCVLNNKLVRFCFLTKPFFWTNKKFQHLKFVYCLLFVIRWLVNLKKKQLNVRSALDSVCKCVIIIFRVEIIKHSVLIVWKYNDQLGIYNNIIL